MSDNEPMIVVSVTVEQFEKMSEPRRAMVMEIDGPYEQRSCMHCYAPIMVGREGCKMLADGRADRTICIACVLDAAEKLNSLLPE